MYTLGGTKIDLFGLSLPLCFQNNHQKHQHIIKQHKKYSNNNIKTYTKHGQQIIKQWSKNNQTMIKQLSKNVKK
jgi:hypothetical protein